MPASNTNDPQSRQGVVTPEQVHAEFERLLRDRHHMGLRNLIGDLALEPRNPFQSRRRRAQRWLVAFCGVALLGLLLVYFFHG